MCFPYCQAEQLEMIVAGKETESKGFKMHNRVKKKAFSLCFFLLTTILAVAQYYFTSKCSDKRNNCSNQQFLLVWIYLTVRSYTLRSPRWKQCHQQSKENRVHRKANIRPTRTLFGVQHKANFVTLVAASLIMYYRPCKLYALTELSHKARISTIGFL